MLNIKQFSPPDKKEDPEKWYTSCFVRNVCAQGGINPSFGHSHACLETLQTKMDFSCAICWKAPKGLWSPTEAVWCFGYKCMNF